VGTVIQDKPQSNPERQPRWDRFERADLFEHYLELQVRSPNGAACPSPKPRRASRRRAASAGCARRPPLGAGELGETSGGGAGATGWGGASGGKGRSRAAVPPRAAPAALAARPPSWPCPAARAGGLLAPARAGPPRV
jgi:hypothetical protein